jgi:hypothetical protein
MTDDVFWASLVSGELDAVTYPSVDQLIGDTDAVLVGSFVSVVAGPNDKDEYGNTNHLATLSFHVARILHGTLNRSTTGTIPVAVFFGAGPAGAMVDPFAKQIQALQASISKEQSVLFLVNMAAWDERYTHKTTSPYDRSAYQIVSRQGILRDVDGAAQPLPGAPGTWPGSFSGRPFDQVVAQLAGLSVK